MELRVAFEEPPALGPGEQWRPGRKVHLTTADGTVDYWCDADDAEGRERLGRKIVELASGDAQEVLVNQTGDVVEDVGRR